MDNKTVQYKRTLRGSVGAGVGALFNGTGRRYFILEHRDTSKYHRAGESQKIIVDQVELGRDGNCQVQFDESFATVSRRHAAIIREGDRWKIVQLSKTNSTFLNGHPVEREWYLENGDEIQLSVGGPRLGFIVPMGNQSLVSSIKMTERLELFRKQALKPYKTAVACLAVVLVVGFSGATYAFSKQEEDIKNMINDSKNKEVLINNLVDKIRRDSTENQRIIDSIRKNPPVIVVKDPGVEIAEAIKKVESSVYAVITTVHASNGSQIGERTSQGTGFLLSDGRFVTARHCVEPWMFDLDEMQTIYACSRVPGSKYQIWADIVAINNKGETFSFSSKEFTIDRTYDAPYPVKCDFGGKIIELNGTIAFGTEASLGNDWAYVQTQSKGAIIDGKDFAPSLNKGVAVHLLGFPQSLGIGDGKTLVDPIYNSMSVSRTGLNNGRCIMVSQGIDHGNSGGPVFIMSKKEFRVVGIVSRGDVESDFYNHLVPMSNLK